MTQYGKTDRAPSAGVVSRPVSGSGKLPPGWHDLEILSVAQYPGHVVVIGANPAGHVHAEAVCRPLPTWLRVGMRVRAKIGTGPGFVVVRDVSRYRALDSETRAPLTGWFEDVGEMYQAARAQGASPASTELHEVILADASWVPVLYRPGPQAGQTSERERPAQGEDQGP